MVAAVVVDPALVEGDRGEMKVVVVTTTAAGVGTVPIDVCSVTVSAQKLEPSRHLEYLCCNSTTMQATN